MNGSINHDILEESFENRYTIVQDIFNSTRCYDLMQTSCKVIVFEACIPFQLAFFALVEHG